MEGGLTNPALGPRLQGILAGAGGGGDVFIVELIRVAVGIVLVVGAVIFFFMLITGAISWMTSGGDKGKIEEARQKISNALLGIVLLIATWAIVRLVEFTHKL